MGQLTNQYVSQSYQGLLNLNNANTGLTTNLQIVTDGLGGSSPLQISKTQVNISGSLTINGSPVTATDTGSLMKTGSVAGSTLTFTKGDGSQFSLAVTSSVPSGTISGSQQIIDLGFLQTSSFNSYTSSNDGKVNSLINATGSYATTSSLTSLSQSIAATDLAQDNRLTAIESITGSLATTGSLNSYTLTSSFNSYTSSANGRLSSLESATSSLQNQINQKLDTGSFNSYTSSNDAKVNSLINATGSYATTGSNNFVGQQRINGNLIVTGSITSTQEVNAGNGVYTSFVQGGSSLNLNATNFVDIKSSTSGATKKVRIYNNDADKNIPVEITGSLVVTGNITATSASITYLETVYETASVIYSSGSNQFGDASNDTQTLYGTVVLPNGPLVVTGSVTATNFTGSLQGTASYATNALSSSHAINADTASFATTTISSSYAENAGTSSFARDIFVVGKNTTGGLLTKGTVVRIGGSTGDQALIVTASFEDDNNSANTLGILAQNIANDASGSVITNGTLLGIDTSGFTAGDILYLSSSGQYTNVLPLAPYHEVRLGQVLRVQQNQGSMYVSIQNGYELSELHDVDITSPLVGDLLVYRSGSYGQWVNETGGEIGLATTSSVNQKLDTGSFNTYTASMDARTGSYATTGSNSFNGNQTITGSVTISGSAQVELDVKGDLTNTGSLSVRSGSIFSLGNSTTVNVNNFLTSSEAGQSNIIRGWGDNFAIGGAGATFANYTGSLRMTGSNNIVSIPQLRATAYGGGTDLQGYISGSDNILNSNQAGIFLNTGSLLFPKTQNNILGRDSGIVMNFTTSSLAGGHPVITNNFIQGGNVQLNSNSGSITSFGTNIINGGSVISTQNFVTNVRTLITQNNINNTVTLNHISSSIAYQSNISTSPLTINNHLSSSNITNNNLQFANNAILGGSLANGVNIWVSGSQSSNAVRVINDNLIGGRLGIISSSFVSSSNSNLISSLMYGQNLIVSGNHSSSGGSAFLGRFNDATSLHLAQDIVFAVGTGTGTSARRTGLYVTSGSLVGVSGSLDVKGTSTFTGSVNVIGNTTLSGSSPLQVGTSNNVGVIKTLGGSNWLYRSTDDYNTIIGNVQGLNNGFFAGSEKNMVLNGFFSPFATGSNNVIIQGAGDDFISGSGNIFIGSHGSHAGGSNNILLGSTSYSSGSIFNSKFELGTQNDSRIFHKDSGQPLQIGYDTQVTGSLRVSNGTTVTGSLVASGSATVTGSVNISNVLKLQALNPLPGGSLGELAVSSSNELYFHNGTAWTLIS